MRGLEALSAGLRGNRSCGVRAAAREATSLDAEPADSNIMYRMVLISGFRVQDLLENTAYSQLADIGACEKLSFGFEDLEPGASIKSIALRVLLCVFWGSGVGLMAWIQGLGFAGHVASCGNIARCTQTAHSDYLGSDTLLPSEIASKLSSSPR